VTTHWAYCRTLAAKYPAVSVAEEPIFVRNRSDIAEGALGDGWWYPEFPAVLNAARSSAWGRGDLFPGFGMPTLTRP
jgi:hypothetical protein